MTEVLALTQALIARDSVTPNDAGCLDMIADRLRPLDFHLEFISAGGVTNLWARRGKAAGCGFERCPQAGNSTSAPGAARCWMAP